MSARLTEEDYTIEAYIHRRTDGRYDEVIQPEGRWNIFSALSELRTSLYSWFDFKENAALLEVNAGYGAVTAAFLRKGLQVTAVEPEKFQADCLKDRFAEFRNLQVENCTIDDVAGKYNQAFDYIVLTDVLNGNDIRSSAALLVKLKKLLKHDGKFLIAGPNKYGLRYLCGNGDENEHLPFGSLTGRGDSAHFTREDLIKTAEMAGLKHYQFYYPLPTHTITQAVYSDRYLPNSSIGERISFYGDRKDEELVTDERKLYRDVIESGTFPFHANSFLMECGQKDNLSEITFATVTTDRGFESACATTVRGEKVFKTCIYPEGKKSIARILKSGDELKARGVRTVDLKPVGDRSLEMPRMESLTLSDVLREAAAAGDREMFLSIFDRLYEQILTSSEPSEVNAFPGAMETVYGPVLKTCYIDMIPLNCFYQDEQLIFFDQEFVRHNWPANYVMFRALRYTYGPIPEAEKLIKLTDMQARYGITAELWDQYEAEEARFVGEIRRYDLYQCFYYKTVWNEEQIARNRLRLAQTYRSQPADETVREDDKTEECDSENILVTWTPSAAETRTAQTADQQSEKLYTYPELKAIWEVELDLLRKFKAICDENNLTYYLWAGSMLGAVRHGGIIPWDDDIDVAMPRKDFETFRQICKTSLSAPYSLQSDDDRTIFMGGKLRLRNSNTTGFEYREVKYGGSWGIWIDILALDPVFRDERKKKKQLERIDRAVKACRHDLEKSCRVSSWHLSRFNRAVTRCPEAESGALSIFTAAFRAENARVYDLSLFKKQMMLKYQDLQMPVPSRYDTILQMQYGDYTRLLPVEKRKPSHIGVFNPNVPFGIYQKRITEAFRYDSSKILVLFGAGNMLRSYMERHGRKHRPAFIVDNNASKWGLEYKGVPIWSPEKLKETPADRLHIIICSNCFAQIAEQLEEMGIRDYTLYVETLTNLSGVLFPGYAADGSLEKHENFMTEGIDFFGYGVGKRIDERTGLVVPSDKTFMTSDKVWHAYPGSRLVLKNKHYHYAIATYHAQPDGALIYTYLYAPDMNWTGYNHDLLERGFMGRDYVFEDERYFRVVLTRLDGGEIPQSAETEGILQFVHPQNSSMASPAYYSEEIDQTCAEIGEARKSAGAPLTIALLTDTHYAPGTTWEKSLSNLNAVNDRVHFDSIIHLGDLTDGLGSKLLTKHYAEYVMNGLRKTGIPTYLVIGNHDTNYFRGNPDVYSLPEQFDVYHSGRDPADTVRTGADLWYHVDRYPQKLRMLFLGSFDASMPDRYGFWDEEVDWVQKTLNETPPEWCVMVFCHVPLLPEMHYWNKKIRNAERMLEVLKQFNGEEGRLLGFIHGHNHGDQINTKHGFPIVSIGSNKMEYFTYYKPEGAVTYRRTAGSPSEDLWDTLVIDTQHKKLDFIRFGAGDNRSVQICP